MRRCDEIRTNRSPRSDALRACARALASISLGLLAPLAASALVSVPFREASLILSTTSTTASYTVDLGSLPMRPRLIVEAIPDAAHGDMTIELRITGCTIVNPGGGSCRPSVVSPSTAGPQSVSYSIFECNLAHTFPAYVGDTCDVTIQATSFGTRPGPANVELMISGETVVPTATVASEVSTTTQTVWIEPTKDTTIYEPSPEANNGRGMLLSIHHVAEADRRNSLLAFDVPSSLPAGATIIGASIELELVGATGQPVLDLFAIPRDPTSPWLEGTGFSLNGFTPLLSFPEVAVRWTHRLWQPAGAVPWSTLGGDRELPALVSLPISAGTGRFALTSPALLGHVQALHAGSTLFDGFLLTATNGGVQVASRENISPWLGPRLVIQYQVTPPISGSSVLGTLSYFSEGQNFRWIYDVDDDNVLITPIAGHCTVTSAFPTNFLYSYSFEGNQSYQGLDCCTWQIGSPTGVTGAGQAIFFVNVSSTDPAYQPTDYDGDGIKDNCDNCPSVPNGPLLGSCTSGSKIGKLCRTNQDCGNGSTCSQAQDDADRIPPGNACVPEPTGWSGISIGLICTLLLARGRDRQSMRPVS